MIDAYEIGIELALQDGVTAGLVVVARELAALDLAVAASSAGLVALTRTAEAAAAMVSAAAGIGSPVRPKSAIDRSADDAAVVTKAAMVREGASIQVVNAAAPMGPPAADAVQPVTASARQPEPLTQVQAAQALLPAPTAALPKVSTADVRRKQRDMPSAAAAAPDLPRAPVAQMGIPTQAPVTTSSGVADATTIVVALPAVGRGGRGVAGGPTAPRDRLGPAQQIWADVSRARSVEDSSVGVAPVIERSVNGLRVAEEGIAPPTAAKSTPSRPGVKMTGLFPDRASAPQRGPQGQSAAGGGPVMLDGRLVGHWLSERMAHDAARPAAGTTFFDARQAPAWTPSGVL